MNLPTGLGTVRRPFRRPFPRPFRRPMQPLVVREPPRMPMWVRGTIEAICGLLIVLLAYALVTDIADRRVVEAHNGGVALGQQMFLRLCPPDGGAP